MKRKEFLKKTLQLGMCCSGAVMATVGGSFPLNADDKKEVGPSEDSRLKQEKEFIENWLTDLLNTIDKELDEETKITLFAGTGQGCFNRHKFKRDIAENGKGDLDTLIKAMKKNFECWREGDLVHIRYGKVSPGCYCPVLKDKKSALHKMHCNCTRATHQAIFETALGRPFKVEIVESIRRGGKTCHFVVHV